MANKRLGTLVLDLRARLDSFQQDMSKASSIMKGEVASIGRQAALIQAPFMAIGGFAFKAASDFESAMRDIRVSTGATGQQLKDMGDIVKDVYGQVDESMEEVGRAVATLAQRTGLSGDPLKELTKTMLDFAKVSKMDITESVRLTTRLFGDWQIKTEDQKAALDKLLNISHVTGISFAQLMETMTYYGVPLRQLGFTFEQVALMLGKFEKEGVNVEQVIAGLGRGLGAFMTKGLSPAEAMATALKKISTESEEAANKLGMALFGKRPGVAVNIVGAIREGRFNLEEDTQKLKKMNDTLEDAAKAAKTMTERFQEAWHQAQIALIPLGKMLIDKVRGELIPAIKDTADSIAKLGVAFNNLSKPTQNWAMAIGVVTTGLLAGAPLIGIWLEKSAWLIGSFTKLGVLISSWSAAAIATAGSVGVAFATALAVPTAVFASWEAFKKVWNYFSDRSAIKEAKANLEEANLYTWKNLQGWEPGKLKTLDQLAAAHKTITTNTKIESKATNDLIVDLDRLGEKRNREITLLEQTTNRKLGYIDGLSEEAQWLRIVNALHEQYFENLPDTARAAIGQIRDIKLPEAKALDMSDTLKKMGIEPGKIDVQFSRIRTMQDVIREGWENVARVMQDSFAFGFSDILSGAVKLGEGLKNIWNSIKRSFFDLIGQMISAFMMNFVKRITDRLSGATFGGGLAVGMPTIGLGGFGGGATGGYGTTAGGIGTAVGSVGIGGSKIGGGLMSGFLGAAPLLGIGLGASLGTGLGGLFGGGTAGSILGGIAGGLGGGIIGISALGAGITGTGLGGMLGAMGWLASNPWTIGIAAALGIGIAINKWYKSAADRAAQEASRDFGNINVTSKTFEQFASSLGLGKKQYEGIRKDLLSSPKFLTEVAYPLAKQQGKVDSFLAALSNVTTAWGTFNFRPAFEEWMRTGNAGALNKVFQDAFEHSQALSNYLPDWQSVLSAPGSSTSGGRVKLNRPVGQLAGNQPVTVININVSAIDGQSVIKPMREVIMPEIVEILSNNTNNLRVQTLNALGV